MFKLKRYVKFKQFNDFNFVENSSHAEISKGNTFHRKNFNLLIGYKLAVGNKLNFLKCIHILT